MTSLRVKFLTAAALVAVAVAVLMLYAVSGGVERYAHEQKLNMVAQQSALIASIWQQSGGCGATPPGLDFAALPPEASAFAATGIFAYCDGVLVSKMGNTPEPQTQENAPGDVEDPEHDMVYLYEGHSVDNGWIIIGAEASVDDHNFTAFVMPQIYLPVIGLVLALMALWWRSSHWFAPLSRIEDAPALPDLPVELLPLVQHISKTENALKTLSDKLETKLEYERQFTANAAHELLTPLTAIKAEAQLQVALAKGDEAHLAFQHIIERVDRASHTVDQLMTLARLDPQMNNVDPEAFDVAVLLRNTIAEYGHRIAGKSLELEASIPETLRFSGVPGVLRIMFENLLDNAIRYSPEGGPLQIALSPGANGFACSFQNNCQQRLPRYLIDHIDQRFVRGANEAETGTGLGMSIINRCAELHGLTVSVSPQRDFQSLEISIS
ncbi:MAG: hypothetical protein CSA68_07950 [Rhodobacterales bacterium]|nr:MAG: hypothetical protein CSA68_07950 [Rhodobacterales bacterium]